MVAVEVTIYCDTRPMLTDPTDRPDCLGHVSVSASDCDTETVEGAARAKARAAGWDVQGAWAWCPVCRAAAAETKE